MSTTEATPVSRTISPSARLAAFALISMAVQHENSTMLAHRALNKVLGFDEDHQGRMTDLIWSSFAVEEISAAKFDEALRLEGISVEPDPLADKAAAMVKALSEATEAKTDPIFDDAADVIRKLVAALSERKVS